MAVPLSSGEEHMHSFEDAVQSYGKLGPRETKGRIKVKLFLLISSLDSQDAT